MPFFLREVQSSPTASMLLETLARQHVLIRRRRLWNAIPENQAAARLARFQAVEVVVMIARNLARMKKEERQR